MIIDQWMSILFFIFSGLYIFGLTEKGQDFENWILSPADNFVAKKRKEKFIKNCEHEWEHYQMYKGFDSYRCKKCGLID